MARGPMTGRGAGYCAGFGVPGFMNPILYGGWGISRGWSRGFGKGMAWKRGWWGHPIGWYPPSVPYGVAIAPHNEIDFLKDEAKYFEEALVAINKRISELGAEKK